MNWNHQPVKPYTLALARESGGMADAQGSGPCERKLVGVQVPSLAPIQLSPLARVKNAVGGRSIWSTGTALARSLLPDVPRHGTSRRPLRCRRWPTRSRHRSDPTAAATSRRCNRHGRWNHRAATRNPAREKQRSKRGCNTQFPKHVSHEVFPPRFEYSPSPDPSMRTILLTASILQAVDRPTHRASTPSRLRGDRQDNMI